MKRFAVIAALLALPACDQKKKQPEPPPPAPAAAPAAPAAEVQKLGGPKDIKAKVEGAEQKHEEHMDKRYEEATQQ
jgi:hypothetical protein